MDSIVLGDGMDRSDGVQVVDIGNSEGAIGVAVIELRLRVSPTCSNLSVSEHDLILLSVLPF